MIVLQFVIQCDDQELYPLDYIIHLEEWNALLIKYGHALLLLRLLLLEEHCIRFAEQCPDHRSELKNSIF